MADIYSMRKIFTGSQHKTLIEQITGIDIDEHKTGEELAKAMKSLDMEFNPKASRGKLIDDLNLEFNKARQAAITQEILEIAAATAAG